MAGTYPDLVVTAQGSLQALSRNESVGRHRWRETVTIAWRGGRFVVAGFTHQSRDTLEPGLSRHCDANLLTGRGVLDGEPFETRRGGIPVEAWEARLVPAECAAG